MLNANINYPYPVIRSYVEDYKNTIFVGALTVNLQPDGYLVRPNFSVNNAGISSLIANGKLTYALEVSSPATWYRKLFVVHENKPIKLEPTYLHERVELMPCIIAAESVKSFINDDFDDAYQGISFDVKAGDIIAIGEVRSFDALFQNDVIRNGASIVKVDTDVHAKGLSCDFTNSTIKVTIPTDQFDYYTQCGNAKAKYKTLNAILIVPVLVEAIGIISNDDENPDHTSGFEKKAWYKTIVVNLKRVAENNEAKYRQLLKKPFSSAELLLANNYAAALQFVVNAG